ncbi:Splicing factor 3B subunit 3 [Nymphaea thermarum]|nr:Splicing factor 3B subunit 3 [Nymphaea thermarum]
MAVSEEELGAEPKPTNSVHYLAKTVLKGSAILHAAHGRIRSPTTFDIVLGKETSIELVEIGEDGILQSVCEQTVFGIIKDLSVLRWNDKCRAVVSQTHGKDLLVVLSDSGKLTFLTFSIKMHRFFPVAHIHLSQPGNSRYQLGRMLAVDPNGCFVAVAAYENQLAVLPVSASAGNNIVDKKILYPAPLGGDPSSTRDSQDSISGTIWSFCFASRDFTRSANEACDPILAVIIHRKKKILNELLLLEFSSRDSSIHVVSQYKDGSPLFLAVDEVPHLPGLLLLFKIGEVLLLDIRDPYHANCVYRANLCVPISSETKDVSNECCRTLEVDDEGIFSVAACALLELSDSGMDISKEDDPMSIDGESSKFISNSSFICTWDWDPEKSANSKMIFCTDAGELYMLSVSCDVQGYFKVAITSCLYDGLHCKKLLWVKGGFIASFVEMGDGLILKLDEGRLFYQSSVQNICPILDVSVVDYHNEEQYQIFAACGVGSEGSLRIIRSGINIEKLLRTAPIYEGVTGIWSLRMKKGDPFHAFLVISFVEETRVLSIGVSFCDVTDSVGFFPDSCTVACGLVEDRVLVQICRHEVRICVPTVTAHSEGIPSSYPICKSWKPEDLTINLGAVGNNLIVVATSNPCILFILGTRLLSFCNYEIFEIQKIKLQAEVSCISIPQEDCSAQQTLQSTITYAGGSPQAFLPNGIEICKTFVIGTHKPSVELLSLVPREGFKVLAVGKISLTNAMGTAISWCIPQDVRIVILDQFYIVSGLRNGMLLWFQWPVISSSSSSDYVSPNWTATDLPSMVLPLVTENMQQYVTVNVNETSEGSSPVQLQLVAARRIGVTPVFLAPLSESLYADIIALCDRPWLLQTARQSQRIAYTSISFQSASHVTPICSADCPKGILFVAENCLHLVELVHMKRLNVQKFDLGGTPRRILFHSESRTLLVMRTESSNDFISMSSDICRVDPVSGFMNSCFKFDPGETPKCMQLTKVGNEQLLVVGTSLSTGRIIMASGEAERNYLGHAG